MSAYISFPYPDRIELLADGATCLPSGLLIADTDKVQVSPYVPLAVTGRGSHRDIEAVSKSIIDLSACGSVDATLAGLAAGLSEHKSADLMHGLEIMVAAWSESQGPVRAYFCSFEQEGIPARTLMDCGDVVFGGGPDFDESDIAALELAPDALAGGAAEGGLTIMEMLRSKPGSDPTNPDGVHGYWIGGHVDHAVIDRHGVTVNRIHDWGDELFKKIDPAFEANRLRQTRPANTFAERRL